MVIRLRADFVITIQAKRQWENVCQKYLTESCKLNLYIQCNHL